MYYSYVEIDYVATSFSPARTDLSVRLLTLRVFLRLAIRPSATSHCAWPCHSFFEVIALAIIILLMGLADLVVLAIATRMIVTSIILMEIVESLVIAIALVALAIVALMAIILRVA
jgi:hypothetical protein